MKSQKTDILINLDEKSKNCLCASLSIIFDKVDNLVYY